MTNLANKQTIWNKTYVFMLIANAFLALSQNIVNPLIVQYGGWLGADTVLIGFMSGLYFGVAFLMRPVSGPVITVFNRKMLLILSYALGAIVYFIYAVFQDMGWFIAARILQGIEFSIVGSLLMALTSDSLPKEKLGMGMGIYNAGNSLALAVGPSIGIALRNYGDVHMGGGGGFKLSFLIAAVIMVLALVPCILSKPVQHSKEELKEVGPWYKNIIATQAIPPSILIMLLFVSYSLFSAYMIPYSAEKGFSNIGSFFLVHAIAMLIFRLACSRIIDKIGVGLVIVTGFIICGMSFAVIGLSKSMATVYLGAVLSAVGFGATLPSVQVLCIQSVTPIKRGVASNTNFLGIDLGQFLGPMIGGIVLKTYESTGRAYSTLYLFAIIPIALALLVYVVTRKIINRNLKAAENM